MQTKNEKLFAVTNMKWGEVLILKTLFHIIHAICEGREKLIENPKNKYNSIRFSCHYSVDVSFVWNVDIRISKV